MDPRLRGDDKAIVKKGANVNLIIHKNKTALNYAISFDYDKLVQVLLEYGADINIGSPNETSCWALLCAKQKTALQKLVVKTGTLKLRENEVMHHVHIYDQLNNEVKRENFEKKCKKDIIWLESNVVAKWDNLMSMLKYYVNGYRSKSIIDKEPFFDKNALEVQKAIKIYVSKNWSLMLGSKSKPCVDNYEKHGIVGLPKLALHKIGGDIFNVLFEEIETSGGDSLL